MGRKAFEQTVDPVAKQYAEWGVSNAEERARTDCARAAERGDRIARAAPPAPDPIDPKADLAHIEMDKEARIKMPLTDVASWKMEKITGNAPPRVGFHRPPDRAAMRELHETTEARLRRRLGG